MPKVSIIISTFNRSSLLKQAIQSVYSQTFQDWELIIVDDGSTDETKKMIHDYANLDSRIIPVSQSNKGISASRAKGIEFVTGQYIASLDDDDVYVPQKIEAQFDYLEKNPSVGLVYSYVNMVDENKTILLQWPVTPAQTFFELLHDNTIPTNSCLIRKECFERLGSFRKDFKGSDDYEMWLRISKHYRIKFLPIVIGIYRWHDHNMSHNKRKRCSSDVQVFQAVMKYELSKEEKKKVFQRVIELTYTKGSDALDQKNYSDAVFYFLQSLQFNLLIGLHISWGRYSNVSYRLLRPYAALVSAAFGAFMFFMTNLFSKEQLSSNV